MNKKTIKTVILHFKVGSEETIKLARTVASFLKENGIEVYCEEYTCAHFLPELKSVTFYEMKDRADLVIVFGGDGSMLGASRELAIANIPVLGINRGHLGFLTDLKPSDVPELLKPILKGKYFFEERFLLDTQIIENGKRTNQSLALNEAVIHSVKTAHMMDFSIYVNDKFMYSQKADGLIISTPTGSTAYNLSAGGPIIEPSLNIISLVAMFPHSMNCRPLLLSADSTLKVIFKSKASLEEITLTCDSQIIMHANEGAQIIIKKSPQILTICHPYSYDYFETLRCKLGFASKIVE